MAQLFLLRKKPPLISASLLVLYDRFYACLFCLATMSGSSYHSLQLCCKMWCGHEAKAGELAHQSRAEVHCHRQCIHSSPHLHWFFPTGLVPVFLFYYDSWSNLPSWLCHECGSDTRLRRGSSLTKAVTKCIAEGNVSTHLRIFIGSFRQVLCLSFLFSYDEWSNYTIKIYF